MPAPSSPHDNSPSDIHERVAAEALAIRAQVPNELLIKIEKSFSIIAPRDRSQLSPNELIDQAEQKSVINPDPPVTSSSPVGRAVKQTIRKLNFFYIKFLTDQINEFTGRSVHAHRAINARIDELESQRAQTSPEPIRSFPGPLFLEWSEVPGLVDTYTSASGRALVLGPVDNGLVVEMVSTSPTLSVYGVGSDVPDNIEPMFLRGDEIVHLGTVAPASLNALVMFGIAERLTPGQQLSVATLALAALAPKAAVTLLSLDPQKFFERLGDQADDGPQRPISASSWAAAFTRAGCSALTITRTVNGFAVRATAS